MLRFNLEDVICLEDNALFQYILCYGSTSSCSDFFVFNILFQYILCYGSTIYYKHNSTKYHHFNTSYVTVQHLQKKEMPVTVWDFNTSYVTVQQTG